MGSFKLFKGLVIKCDKLIGDIRQITDVVIFTFFLNSLLVITNNKELQFPNNDNVLHEFFDFNFANPGPWEGGVGGWGGVRCLHAGR